MKRLFLSFASLVFVMLPMSASVFAQSTPVNYIGINFGPITTSTSYNYNWSTGTMTLGTATGSVSSTGNGLESQVSDPTPPPPTDMEHLLDRTTREIAYRRRSGPL